MLHLCLCGSFLKSLCSVVYLQYNFVCSGSDCSCFVSLCGCFLSLLDCIVSLWCNFCGCLYLCVYFVSGLCVFVADLCCFFLMPCLCLCSCFQLLWCWSASVFGWFTKSLCHFLVLQYNSVVVVGFTVVVLRLLVAVFCLFATNCSLFAAVLYLVYYIFVSCCLVFVVSFILQLL